VISTSLYFVVFGAAIGSRIAEIDGTSYGAFIVPELSIQYEGWRDKDPSKYHNPVSTVPSVGGPILVEPPIDQVMTSYTIRF
jgi:hypothetical protein